MSNGGRHGNRAHLEIVPFDVDDSPSGYMVHPGVPPSEQEVYRTAENDHFFMYNHTSERFEVLHYGSALIVSMLRLYEPTASERELALFDTSGNFHDRIRLREPLFPRETDSGSPNVRHMAFFDEHFDGKIWPFTIAVDDIYMLALAKPQPRASE